MEYIIFSSGGNDSVALVQHAKDIGIDNAIVAYNDTMWAHPLWDKRMALVKKHAESLGFEYVVVKSKGFKQMVKDKKGFPMAASRMSFCTQVLKTIPTLEWLKNNDPHRKMTCCAGVRREESENRKYHPEWLYMTKLYEGRKRWFPIVDLLEKERNVLLNRAGFEPLPHSSLECFPCINSNRKDLRLLATMPDKIDEIELLETIMGYTSKGKPRVMFRPRNYMGATGIREVVKWGLSNHGKYKRSNE
jgi:3'-phosphoadenosine 5'-phosphosulfate sulfotransferase (PAPS reductase)/FAD synthetase